MEVCILGVSHQTAPIEIREKIAFSKIQLPDALKGIHSLPDVKECLIISTCNRTEVVAVVKKGGRGIEEIKAFILKFHNLDEGALYQSFYVYSSETAVSHIFRVASSLESMMIGEPQILGQIKEAFQCAHDACTTGPFLNNLLNQAIRVAKKIRTDTGIARNAVSISFAAVELARKIFGDISGKAVLLIGAGEMSELAARHLISNGVKRIIVANRTWQRAQDLAEIFGGEPVPFEQIHDLLDQVDIIITSTGAPHLILHKSDISSAMHKRKNRPMFLIDIAVPRDIDPEANKCDNVYLYDIDDLQIVVEANLKERQKEAKKAAEIIDQELARFIKGCALMEVMPTIAQLGIFMEEIRKKEVERAISLLPSIENGQRQVLEAMTEAIIKKIIHRPISRLKDADDPEALKELVNATKKLFDLKD
ncbi:glutamyl-tRNA reductase [bacterium]|nr:glutamyl-tRNA reductase [bacterium]